MPAFTSCISCVILLGLNGEFSGSSSSPPVGRVMPTPLPPPPRRFSVFLLSIAISSSGEIFVSTGADFLPSYAWHTDRCTSPFCKTKWYLSVSFGNSFTCILAPQCMHSTSFLRSSSPSSAKTLLPLYQPSIMLIDVLPPLLGHPLHIYIYKIFSENLHFWAQSVTSIKKNLPAYHGQVLFTIRYCLIGALISINFPTNILFNPLFFSSNLSVFCVNVGSKGHKKAPESR